MGTRVPGHVSLPGSELPENPTTILNAQIEKTPFSYAAFINLPRVEIRLRAGLEINCFYVRHLYTYVQAWAHDH